MNHLIGMRDISPFVTPLSVAAARGELMAVLAVPGARSSAVLKHGLSSARDRLPSLGGVRAAGHGRGQSPVRVSWRPLSSRDGSL